MTETWVNPNKKKTEKEKPKDLESFVKQSTRGPRNLGAALNKLVHKAANLPSEHLKAMGSPGAAELLSVYPGMDIDKLWGLTHEKDWSDYLLQAAPEMAGAMLMPELQMGRAGELISKIPKAGKYMSKILSEAIPQSAYAGLMAEPEHRGEAAGMAGATQAPFSIAAQLAMSNKPKFQKIASLLAGAAGGLAGGYGLNALGAPGYVSTPLGIALGVLGKNAFGTKAMMMQEHAGGKNLPLAQERLAAAERIGLDFLTPAEAFNSPYLGRVEGRLGRTEEGSEHLYDKFQKRVESEATAIDKVLKQIHDPEIMGPQAKKLYEQAYLQEFTPDPSFETNPIMHEAIKMVESEPAFQHSLRDTPTNTIAYFDHVKQALCDMAEGAPEKQASIINKTRKDLVEAMDEVSPEYKEARALEERKFVREDLEKAFDKTNINSGAAFFKALRSKEKFEEILHHLRNVPEAQQALKDMREIFKDFRDVSTVKRVKGLEQTGMKQHRNMYDKLEHVLENMFTGGKFDKEAIDFITAKDWDKQLAEINKISDGQKRMAKIIEVFGKGVSQAAAKEPQKKKQT